MGEGPLLGNATGTLLAALCRFASDAIDIVGVAPKGRSRRSLKEIAQEDRIRSPGQIVGKTRRSFTREWETQLGDNRWLPQGGAREDGAVIEVECELNNNNRRMKLVKPSKATVASEVNDSVWWRSEPRLGSSANHYA